VIDDDSPAFPSGIQPLGYASEGSAFEHGMTLFQYTTIECMKALLSNPSVVGSSPMKGWELINCTPSQLADFAAHLAHQTLAAARSGHGRPTGEA